MLTLPPPSPPSLLLTLRSCKSPQMMMGAVVKSYFASNSGVAPEDVVSCSVMPCVRKQGEADRTWFTTEGGAGVVRDVDHVITTAELGKIFQEKGINLAVRRLLGPQGVKDGARGWAGQAQGMRCIRGPPSPGFLPSGGRGASSARL
jgi:iron only hydrogenase large subunit-like protein